MIKKNKTENYLILLCWLIYTCSYIGKLSYNANINQIRIQFDMTYQQTGTVTTFFFFAYGIGQVLNGLFCKRYNIKYTIFTSLVVSSILNVLLVTINDTSIFKFIWLLNGVSMSFLWTSLIRLLSETISKAKIGRAIVVMGTTVATGTFLVYSLSALFVAVLDYRFTFYTAATLMLIVSFVWFINYNSAVDHLLEKKKEEALVMPSQVEERNVNFHLGIFFIILALFATANNFTKDGLTVWTPDILDALYNTPEWLSILLTLFLPMFGICGTILVVKLHKNIKNFIVLCTLMYGMSTILLLMVILFINKNMIPITIGSFALIACLMAGVNNIITSMIPLEMNEKVNSGKLAGLLNGFCYLGSTLSAYGLGTVADLYGWSAVFSTLLIILISVCLIGVIYIILKYKRGSYL